MNLLAVSRLIVLVCISASVSLVACSERTYQYTAWRCFARKDVMAFRVGSIDGIYESISFDAGGMALHLRGRRPFAPDYDDVVISQLNENTIQLNFPAKKRNN